MLQVVYLTFCILGTILPYSQFVPFLLEHGLNLQLFFEQLFVNRISSFFALDFTISTLVFLTLVFSEGVRFKIKHLWIYVATLVTVGLSLALPLFLLARQRKLEAMASHNELISA